MSRQRYPEEFKVEAVKQVVDRGHSVADVAGRLGIDHAQFVRMDQEVRAGLS